MSRSSQGHATRVRQLKDSSAQFRRSVIRLGPRRESPPCSEGVRRLARDPCATTPHVSTVACRYGCARNLSKPVWARRPPRGLRSCWRTWESRAPTSAAADDPRICPVRSLDRILTGNHRMTAVACVGQPLCVRWCHVCDSRRRRQGCPAQALPGAGKSTPPKPRQDDDRTRGGCVRRSQATRAGTATRQAIPCESFLTPAF